MKKIFLLTLTMIGLESAAQTMTPELLWSLGRVTPLGISKDGKNVVYKVATPSVAENKSQNKFFTVPIGGGASVEVQDYKALLKDKNVSPDGKYILYHEAVAIDDVLAYGQGVLVHCRAGMQRSAAVVAAYVMWKRGWTANKALEFINRKKNETFWPVPTFEAALRAWETQLRAVGRVV